ncbi:7939_t:CDS:2, partial [Funneliformis caledonium]
MSLDDIICNSCYCKVVEHDTYQKYRKASRTNVTKYDKTFSAPKSKKACVTMDVDTYQMLVQKINSVEQLESELNELKTQLKNQQNMLANDNIEDETDFTQSNDIELNEAEEIQNNIIVDTLLQQAFS